jgi:hypothetical protein
METLEKLRKTVIKLVEKAKENGSEKELLLKFLPLILVELKDIPDEDWSARYEIRALLKQFCGFFMACLAILRSGQQLDGIDRMEKSFKTKENEIQIQFLRCVLESLCMQANKHAIKLTAYFLDADVGEVKTCAKEILAKAGQNPAGKNVVMGILQSYVPGKTGALSILAEVDYEVATVRAMEIVENNKDKDIRHEALCVLAKATLSKEIAEKMVDHLKGDKTKVLWEDWNYREAVYDFMEQAFSNDLLPQEDAKTLIAKAFESEDGNRGLSRLLSVVKVICPKDEQLLFDGFLVMESQKGHGFSVREESVKEYMDTLKGVQRVEYLQKALLASTDTKFVWFAGQHLMAADVGLAAKTFVACAQDVKSSKEKIGTLAQLAMRVCDEEKDRGNWIANGLNASQRSRFMSVAQALLAYAETDACSTEACLIIAFQPGMFGGNEECCRRANALLEKILLHKEASSGQVLEALQALLSCCIQRQSLVGEVNDILKRAYDSECKERFLSQLLEIIIKDIRGYSSGFLLYPAVRFLESIESADAIPLLRGRLYAALPNSDRGMSARSCCVSALKKFALEGHVDAVVAIAGYREGNIGNEVIPIALVEIYQQTTSAEIRMAVVRGVAERFAFSLTKEADRKVSYFYEISAIEALKEESFIKAAFLKGIVAIGDVATQRSDGMGKLISKIPAIMPKEEKNAVQEALRQLVGNLALVKQKMLAENDKRRVLYRNECFKMIDSLSAEAGMVMVTT